MVQPVTYYERHKPKALSVLHLTLTRKWFDLIRAGKKTVEYRDCKPYWRKRLYHQFPSNPKVFDEIRFRNGYGNHRPLVVTRHVITYYNHPLDKIELILGRIIH